ncbi:unnamed protein product [Parnassius mnemosyne]|uniref:Integrator complex subunit 1 RPB2-binding domain-containing protein n=1 Tax=Parnassius mnemosyne TaxID=213953 RepID=A0AAV1KMW9_9NEOP
MERGKMSSTGRGGKSKAPQHPQDIFALGSKSTVVVSRDSEKRNIHKPSSSGVERKRETSGFGSQPPSKRSRIGSPAETVGGTSLDVEPIDLVPNVLQALDTHNSDKLLGLLTGSIRLLKSQRSKPDIILCMSMLYLTKIRPNMFAHETVTQSLCTLLKREQGAAFKNKGNPLVFVLACNMLYAGHKDSTNWPDTFIKVYIEDALNERWWVDCSWCKCLVENIVTAFGTKQPPSHLIPTDNTLGTMSPSGSGSPLLGSTDEVNDNTELEYSVFPRYTSSYETVEALVLEAIKEQIQRRTAPDTIGKGFLKLLSATCGFPEIRMIAASRLEAWLHSGKLWRAAQELLAHVCANAAAAGPSAARDHEVLAQLARMRLKTKPLQTAYQACLREMVSESPALLRSVVTHTIYNELSNARSPNNMAVLAALIHAQPQLVPAAIAETYQELLFRAEDYLRPMRAMLRECVRAARAETQALLPLAAALAAPPPHDPPPEVRERAFQALADLFCCCCLVTAALGRQQAPTELRSQLCSLQQHALAWLLDTAASVYRPARHDYQLALNKIMFVEPAETYSKPDNWPPESERALTYRLCCETPLPQNTLLRLIFIGLSKDIPVSPAEVFELIEQLVRRACALPAEDMPLQVDKLEIADYIFQLCQFHPPDNITLPAGYSAPALAITGLYWRGWLLLAMLAAHNPHGFAERAAATYPTLRALIEMCITGKPSIEWNNNSAAEAERAEAERASILQLETHLATASNAKLPITEHSSRLLSQLTVLEPLGPARRPPSGVADALVALSSQLKLGRLLCRQPALLLQLVERHGTRRAMPWLHQLLRHDQLELSVLPVQCLCEFLSAGGAGGAGGGAGSSGGGEAGKASELCAHLRRTLASEEGARAVLHYYMQRLAHAHAPTRAAASRVGHRVTACCTTACSAALWPARRARAPCCTTTCSASRTHTRPRGPPPAGWVTESLRAALLHAAPHAGQRGGRARRAALLHAAPRARTRAHAGRRQQGGSQSHCVLHYCMQRRTLASEEGARAVLHYYMQRLAHAHAPTRAAASRVGHRVTACCTTACSAARWPARRARAPCCTTTCSASRTHTRPRGPPPAGWVTESLRAALLHAAPHSGQRGGRARRAALLHAAPRARTRAHAGRRQQGGSQSHCVLHYCMQRRTLASEEGARAVLHYYMQRLAHAHAPTRAAASRVGHRVTACCTTACSAARWPARRARAPCCTTTCSASRTHTRPRGPPPAGWVTESLRAALLHAAPHAGQRGGRARRAALLHAAPRARTRAHAGRRQQGGSQSHCVLHYCMQRRTLASEEGARAVLHYYMQRLAHAHAPTRAAASRVGHRVTACCTTACSAARWPARRARAPCCTTTCSASRTHTRPRGPPPAGWVTESLRAALLHAAPHAGQRGGRARRAALLHAAPRARTRAHAGRRQQGGSQSHCVLHYCMQRRTLASEEGARAVLHYYMQRLAHAHAPTRAAASRVGHRVTACCTTACSAARWPARRARAPCCTTTCSASRTHTRPRGPPPAGWVTESLRAALLHAAPHAGQRGGRARRAALLHAAPRARTRAHAGRRQQGGSQSHCVLHYCMQRRTLASEEGARAVLHYYMQRLAHAHAPTRAAASRVGHRVTACCTTACSAALWPARRARAPCCTTTCSASRTHTRPRGPPPAGWVTESLRAALLHAAPHAGQRGGRARRAALLHAAPRARTRAHAGRRQQGGSQSHCVLHYCMQRRTLASEEGARAVLHYYMQRLAHAHAPTRAAASRVGHRVTACCTTACSAARWPARRARAPCCTTTCSASRTHTRPRGPPPAGWVTESLRAALLHAAPHSGQRGGRARRAALLHAAPRARTRAHAGRRQQGGSQSHCVLHYCMQRRTLASEEGARAVLHYYMQRLAHAHAPTRAAASRVGHRVTACCTTACSAARWPARRARAPCCTTTCSASRTHTRPRGPPPAGWVTESLRAALLHAAPHAGQRGGRARRAALLHAAPRARTRAHAGRRQQGGSQSHCVLHYCMQRRTLASEEGARAVLHYYMQRLAHAHAPTRAAASRVGHRVTACCTTACSAARWPARRARAPCCTTTCSASRTHTRPRGPPPAGWVTESLRAALLHAAPHAGQRGGRARRAALLHAAPRARTRAHAGRRQQGGSQSHCVLHYCMQRRTLASEEGARAVLHYYMQRLAHAHAPTRAAASRVGHRVTACCTTACSAARWPARRARAPCCTTTCSASRTHTRPRGPPPAGWVTESLRAALLHAAPHAGQRGGRARRAALLHAAPRARTRAHAGRRQQGS